MSFNSKLLAKWQAENTLTQEAAARIINVSQPYFSELLAGKKTPSFELLEVITEKTGYSMDSFKTENPTSTPAGSEALQGEMTA